MPQIEMYRSLKMKALPLILLFAGWVLLWVLYQNRSASKIQEVTVIIAGIIIGALVVITKSEPIKKTITPVYFVSTKDKKLLFFDAPILTYHYLQTGAIYSNYVKRKTDAKQDSSFDFPKEEKPILDLQVIAFLNHLSTFYRGAWYVERESKELPGSRTGLSGPKEGNVNEDVQLVEKNELPVSLKQNIFFEDWKPLTTFAVPKGTKIFYSEGGKDLPSCELRFYKPLSFDISIRIVFSSYMIGLGNVGQYLGLINPEEKIIRTDDPNVSNFGHLALRVTCKATFHPPRAIKAAKSLSIGQPSRSPSLVRLTSRYQRFREDFSGPFQAMSEGSKRVFKHLQRGAKKMESAQKTRSFVPFVHFLEDGIDVTFLFING